MAQNTFKPTLNTSRGDVSNLDRSSIIERSANHHIAKEEKIENLKLKHQIKEEDFNFKPRINSVSKTINRNVNDLYVKQ